MKIIGICGSPRKGNTYQMVEWVLDSCESAGASTELIELKDHNIEPCTGCDACYGTDRPCVINDDMEPLLSKLLEADAIVFGSPNYFFNVSGKMKNFIDRTNPLCNPYLLSKKLAISVCVGARSTDQTSFVNEILKKYYFAMKMNYLGAVIAQAEDPGEITKQENIKLACIDLGNKILENQ